MREPRQNPLSGMNVPEGPTQGAVPNQDLGSVTLTPQQTRTLMMLAQRAKKELDDGRESLANLNELVAFLRFVGIEGSHRVLVNFATSLAREADAAEEFRTHLGQLLSIDSEVVKRWIPETERPDSPYLVEREADGTYLVRQRDTSRVIARTGDPATLQRLLVSLKSIAGREEIQSHPQSGIAEPLQIDKGTTNEGGEESPQFVAAFRRIHQELDQLFAVIAPRLPYKRAHPIDRRLRLIGKSLEQLQESLDTDPRFRELQQHYAYVSSRFHSMNPGYAPRHPGDQNQVTAVEEFVDREAAQILQPEMSALPRRTLAPLTPFLFVTVAMVLLSLAQLSNGDRPRVAGILLLIVSVISLLYQLVDDRRHALARRRQAAKDAMRVEFPELFVETRRYVDRLIEQESR